MSDRFDFAEIADLLRTVPNTSPSFASRVFDYIDAGHPANCWTWTGATSHGGYGVIGRGQRGTENIAAHRAVWELLVGPIAGGMHFDHLCRNHSCVNPAHGEIVTPEENKRRGYGVARLHAARKTCRDGHPLDGMTGGRGSSRRHRYCKTCARQKAAARYAQKGAA